MAFDYDRSSCQDLLYLVIVVDIHASIWMT